jgi:hypothetical protein
MAPPAAKRTTLQKDGGPDPGAVMHGKTFDIKNCHIHRKGTNSGFWNRKICD